MQLVEQNSNLPPVGSYSSVAGGCVSRFFANGKSYSAKFNRGVRGFNIRDVVTVTDAGIRSNILGDGGIIIEE